MKIDAHPSRRALEGFVLGKLSGHDSAAVFRHLLTGCAACKEVTGALWQRMKSGLRATRLPAVHPGDDTADYDTAVARAFEKALAQTGNLQQEALEAETHCTELLRYPEKRRSALIQDTRHLQTWSLCALLIEKSFALRFDSPPQMLQLAKLALSVADNVSAERYSRETVHDLRARSWANLANAFRVMSDLRAARKAFETAEEELAQGTGEPFERASILHLKSALEQDSGRLPEATRLLNHVIAIYRKTRDEQRLAWALVDKSTVQGYAGNYSEAIESIKEALQLKVSEQDEQLLLVAYHNSAWWLAEAGKYTQALETLTELRPTYLKLADRMNVARLHWLEGKVRRGLDEPEIAEESLLRAREIFVQEGIGYDAALVSLDLAMVYAEQGRVSQMRRLAENMLPIFQSRDVHREAMAALIIFRQAAEAEQATASLVRRVAAYLEKARRNPKLRFRPDSE